MKIRTILVAVVIMLLLTHIHFASASTITQGGSSAGVHVQGMMTFIQDKYSDYATDFHFKVWQKEDNIKVKGWIAEISHFTSSTSQYADQPEPAHSTLNNLPQITPTTNPDWGYHAVDVDADGWTISNGSLINVDVDFYLTHWNNMIFSDVEWSRTSLPDIKAGADFGWSVDFPTEDPVLPGDFKHVLTITNYDDIDSLWVTNLVILPMTVDYDDLSQVPFLTDPTAFSVPDKLLNPGDSYQVSINTNTNYFGNHIYFTYDVAMDNAGVPGTVYVNTAFDHPVVPPSLHVEPTTISAAVASIADFTLNASVDNPNRKYILLGSVTGTSPGTLLPGGLITLPLNFDVFTDIELLLLNTPVFLNFMGVLDNEGMSTAQLNSLGPLPGSVGLVMDFAYAMNGPWNYASTPVTVTVVP